MYETQDHHVKAAGDIEGMEIAGVIIEFLPSPVSFLKPVTLHMPVYDLEGEMAKGREFSVAQFDPAQDKWVLKPVSAGKEVIVNGTITGETNSFSLYAAVSFPPQKTHCKKNLGVCVSMSVLGSIVAVAVAALALIPLCCRKADEDVVFLEDEMDILYFYFQLWCAAVDDAKNGPSLGTLVVHARRDLGVERLGEGKRISGAMNDTISGMMSSLSSSFTSSQTSASMGKRVEVMNFWLRVLLHCVLEVASLSLDLSFTIAIELRLYCHCFLISCYRHHLPQLCCILSVHSAYHDPNPWHLALTRIIAITRKSIGVAAHSRAATHSQHEVG